MRLHEEFVTGFHLDPPDGLPDALKSRLTFRSCLRKKEHHSVYLAEEAGEKCILKITRPGAANNLKREQARPSGYTKAHCL